MIARYRLAVQNDPALANSDYGEVLAAFDALATRCAAAEAHRDQQTELRWDANRELAKMEADLTAARAQVAALSDVILWALGERDVFPDRPDRIEGKPYPWYWWRKELRRRFTAALPTPTPQPEQEG